jgi:stalled ribosome rescue protein Dom34
MSGYGPVLAETLEALRRSEAATDAEHVTEMLGGWRAGGLAVVGPEDTLEALDMRQVEELLITSQPDRLGQELAGELVTKAQQNSARIRFIDDPNLLADVGGVGALLRFAI